MKDKNDPDVKNFIGMNLLPEMSDDPFAGEVPTTPKDYSVYRNMRESFMRSAALAQGIKDGETVYKFSAICDERDESGYRIRRKHPKDGHKYSNFCFSCDHVYMHDPVHPEPVYFVPFTGAIAEEGPGSGYFLCGTCFKLLERRRLDINKYVMGKCSICIAEAITRILEINPSLYHDLRKMM